MPLRVATMMGAVSLVVLDVGEICHQRQAPRHVAEMFWMTMEAAMRQRVRVEAPLLAQQFPTLYLPTPCPISNAALDFSESGRLMAQAEAMVGDFLETAAIPTPGQMSGAPHFHDDQPLIHLMQITSV